MLHVLLHMARHDAPFTSEQIAKMLGTNPVVVRRTMSGLRDAGYVRSSKGHGGGWTLAQDLSSLTLLDVHRAVGAPPLVRIGRGDPDSPCAVERVVDLALDNAARQAEAILIDRLGHVTLDDLLGDFDARCRAAGWDRNGPSTAASSDQRDA